LHRNSAARSPLARSHHGADVVAEWEEPPVTFEEWRRARELAAFEAA